MFQKQPTYYKKFQCIGSACKDNCCIGWEIDIDPETLEYYQCQGGPLGQRMQKYIAMEENPHFILQENERCPFLNKENLCDIILALGEPALCDICTEHPRFYNCFGNYREAGLGCCCEEAVRCMVASSEPMQFEMVDADGEAEADYPDEDLWNILYSLRDAMLVVLQNREFAMGERLLVLSTMAEQVQCIFDEELEVDWKRLEDFYMNSNNWCERLPAKSPDAATLLNVRSSYGEIIRRYKTLEILDPSWAKMLEEMEGKEEQIWNHMIPFRDVFADRFYVYEHFVAYLLYRHMLQAVWDGDVLSKVEFAILSCCFLHWIDVLSWLNGEFTDEKQVEHIKNYSKEIEYSTENVEALEEFLAYGMVVDKMEIDRGR